MNNMYSLIEMLRYKRPEGSLTQLDFCIRFIEPMFGVSDTHGNYIKIVNNEDGSSPKICFTAHHDTVHSTEGKQKVKVVKDMVYVHDVTKSSCLGADCTTGIWLILNMVASKIPGVYVIHAGEESGCIGSQALVRDNPDWLDVVEGVISFDRYGTSSIITHQTGIRTASDTFAKCLSDVLSMPQLEADSGGSYTDSNEYSKRVSECTNISVGYYNQHTIRESQDLVYADELLGSLLTADWSKLTFHRDPSVVEMDNWYSSMYGSRFNDYGYFKADYGDYGDEDVKDLFELVCDYPEEVTELLSQLGYSASELSQDFGIQETKYLNNYIQRKVC